MERFRRAVYAPAWRAGSESLDGPLDVFDFSWNSHLHISHDLTDVTVEVDNYEGPFWSKLHD